MKNINMFLESQEESESHKKARALGLEYRGFGYWADPKTGKIVKRSSGDDLRDVNGQDGIEGKEKQDTGDAGKSFDGVMGAGGAAEVAMGEVKPGEQKAPEQKDWKSGPDGDTDVGTEKDEESVDDDAFISSDEEQNKWTAGPDGDNFTTVKSFDKMQEAVLAEADWTGKSKGEPLIPDSKSDRGSEAKHEAERRNLNSDGHGMWFDQANNPVAKTVDGKLVDLTPEEIKRHDLGSRIPGRTTMRDMMKGKREPAGLMKNRIHNAQNAVAGLPKSERDALIDKQMATKDGTYKLGAEKGPYHKANDGQRAIDRMASKGMDDYYEMQAVKELNDESTAYYSDPDYDLYDEGIELGSGAFGSVYMGVDGRSVIKEGQIGRDEMQVMDLLKDYEGFPKLINGEFQSTFKTISQWEASEDGTYDGDESDPVGMGTFWSQADAAKGRFAMSLAQGESVSDASYNWDEITQENCAMQFWGKMATMHKAGVSHNDLHGGNIFYDEDEDEINILDLGLAKVDRFTALMEALASISGNNYQLWHGFNIENVSAEFREQLEANRQQLIEKMADDFSGDEWPDETEHYVTELIEGGIRMTEQQMEDFAMNLDMDEDQLKEYIEILYQGVGEEEDPGEQTLSQRMEGGYMKMMDKIAQANGYKDGKAMAGMFNAANDINREKGDGDIPFKGVDITRNPKQNK